MNSSVTPPLQLALKSEMSKQHKENKHNENENGHIQGSCNRDALGNNISMETEGATEKCAGTLGTCRNCNTTATKDEHDTASHFPILTEIAIAHAQDVFGDSTSGDIQGIHWGYWSTVPEDNTTR